MPAAPRTGARERIQYKANCKHFCSPSSSVPPTCPGAPAASSAGAPALKLAAAMHAGTAALRCGLAFRSGAHGPGGGGGSSCRWGCASPFRTRIKPPPLSPHQSPNGAPQAKRGRARAAPRGPGIRPSRPEKKARLPLFLRLRRNGVTSPTSREEPVNTVAYQPCNYVTKHIARERERERELYVTLHTHTHTHTRTHTHTHTHTHTQTDVTSRW